MKSSYRAEDVEILLKDITRQVEPLENAEREKRIQQGVHYSEMLPKEHAPSEAYLKTFYDALEQYAPLTAWAVGNLAERKSCCFSFLSESRNAYRHFIKTLSEKKTSYKYSALYNFYYSWERH